jgi:hypothetical protein
MQDHPDEDSSRSAAGNSAINVDINLGTPAAASADKTPTYPTPLCTAALTEAEAAERNWDLEFAMAKYSEAMRNCSGLDLKLARDGYRHADHRKGAWWYQAGESFAPVRWLFIYPWRCLLVIILLVIALSPRILPQGGALYWSRTGLQKMFMPKFVGQATIIAPNDLGKGCQVALFATALQYNAGLARQLMSGDRDHFQVRSINLLSMPSGLASTIFKDLPEVKGVNLGGIAQMIMNLGRYFGWRVETHLAFFPAPKNSAESDRMRALATLRWAWFSDTPIHVERQVKNVQDVDDLAFAVASRILGRYFVPDERRDA